MPDLRIRDVSKTDPSGVHALQRIKRTIPPGMYGLPGPNGAGQPTLMPTIATLQEPNEGEIHPGSLDVPRQKDVRKQKRGGFSGVQGRTWRRVVSRDALAALERTHVGICTRLLDGPTIAHVFRDGSPGQGFEAVAPDLEDVCFSAMSGHHGAKARAQS